MSVEFAPHDECSTAHRADKVRRLVHVFSELGATADQLVDLPPAGWEHASTLAGLTCPPSSFVRYTITETMRSNP